MVWFIPNPSSSINWIFSIENLHYQLYLLNFNFFLNHNHFNFFSMKSKVITILLISWMKKSIWIHNLHKVMIYQPLCLSYVFREKKAHQDVVGSHYFASFFAVLILAPFLKHTQGERASIQSSLIDMALFPFSVR
jgi:hypothetical protein